jgi:hypothetical protein
MQEIGMALTNAEKQRRWRERQKAKKGFMSGVEAALSKPAALIDMGFLHHGFGEWVASDLDRRQLFTECLLKLSGLPPEELAGGKSGQDLVAVHYTIITCLEAATTLAGLVSEFKRNKLMERVQTMELSGLKEGREEALQEVAQLARMHDDYSRKSRAELSTFLLERERDALTALSNALDSQD